MPNTGMTASEPHTVVVNTHYHTTVTHCRYQ